jgi:hypothetical protein
VATSYGVSVERVRLDVNQFLMQLVREGFLVPAK